MGVKGILIAFRLEPHIAEKLESYASKENQSRSYIIRQALMRLLEEKN